MSVKAEAEAEMGWGVLACVIIRAETIECTQNAECLIGRAARVPFTASVVSEEQRFHWRKPPSVS